MGFFLSRPCLLMEPVLDIYQAQRIQSLSSYVVYVFMGLSPIEVSISRTGAAWLNNLRVVGYIVDLTLILYKVFLEACITYYCSREVQSNQ